MYQIKKGKKTAPCNQACPQARVAHRRARPKGARGPRARGPQARAVAFLTRDRVTARRARAPAVVLRLRAASLVLCRRSSSVWPSLVHARNGDLRPSSTSTRSSERAPVSSGRPPPPRARPPSSLSVWRGGDRGMQEQRTVEGLTLVGGDGGRELGRADGARTGDGAEAALRTAESGMRRTTDGTVDGAAAELWTVDGRRRCCAGCRRAWKFSAA